MPDFSTLECAVYLGETNLPDHVAVETDFIYYLIYNEINYLDQDFTDDALNFW